MSRLYFKGSSDTKIGFTSTGNNLMCGKVFYGSSANSIKVLDYEVIWNKNEDHPILKISTRTNIKIIHDSF